MLEERDIDFEVVEYLNNPLTREQLIEIQAMLPTDPADLVRKDGHFKELELDAGNYTTVDQVADLLVEHPRLMQRPILVRDGRAVIGRPAELILDLLD